MHSCAELWQRQYFDLLPFFFSGHLRTAHSLGSAIAAELGAVFACWSISSDAKLEAESDERVLVVTDPVFDSTSAVMVNSKSITLHSNSEENQSENNIGATIS